MDLLFFIEFDYDLRKQKFTGKRCIPNIPAGDAIIPALTSGFRRKLPFEKLVMECWGASRASAGKFDYDEAFRSKFTEVAETRLVSVKTVPEYGIPPGLVQIRPGKGKSYQPWYVVLHVGSKDDSAPRLEYCRWVLDRPDNKLVKNLVDAIKSVELSLSNVDAPAGFRECVQRIDDVYEAWEDYCHQRIDWLLRGLRYVKLGKAELGDIVDVLEELKECSSRLSRTRPLVGKGRGELFELGWREFFDRFNAHRETAPTKLLVQVLQGFLNLQVGKRFDSVEERIEFAEAVNATLMSLKQRVICPGVNEKSCGMPANFRCKEFNPRDGGIFYFTHTQGRQIFVHGFSSVVPRLTIVPAPPRASRRKAKSPSDAA